MRCDGLLPERGSDWGVRTLYAGGMNDPGPERLLYRRRHRLTHDREFQVVYAQGIRRSGGPLTVFVRPNGLPEHRLGLSVGRRVGGAVVRNRVKRLLREAFRHRRAGFAVFGMEAGAFDLVIQVRPHRVLGRADYEHLLERLVDRACAELTRRELHRKEKGDSDGR